MISEPNPGVSSASGPRGVLSPGLYFEELRIPTFARPSDFRMVFRASPDAMILVGAEGRILDANPRAEAMFGWPRPELIGESIEVLVPPGLRDRHREHRRAYARSPESRPMGVGMELEAVRSDGVAFPVEIGLGPLTGETGEALVVCTVRTLAQSHLLRRVAAARVLAIEAERSRIARDLHDEVKQGLTAAQLHLAALAGEGIKRRDADEILSGVQRAMDHCHDALDRVIRDLMPLELEGRGIDFALRVLCRRTQDRDFTVRHDIRWRNRPLGTDTRLAVFRIVQEALNNARQHSGAESATVRCWLRDRTLCAEVTDTGRGFVPDGLEPHLSVGIASMRERSRIVGGSLTVASAPGEGTSVRLEIPLHPPREEGPE